MSKKFAVLAPNNFVLNIIVADSKESADEVTGANCVEYTDENPAHIGLTYDGETFEQPVYEEEVTE